jgi:hypothetical protein
MSNLLIDLPGTYAWRPVFLHAYWKCTAWEGPTCECIGFTQPNNVIILFFAIWYSLPRYVNDIKSSITGPKYRIKGNIIRTAFWIIIPCNSERDPTFRRNISCPSSGSKVKPSLVFRLFMFFICLSLWSWWWSRNVHPKCWVLSELHKISTQNGTLLHLNLNTVYASNLDNISL